MKTKSIGFIGGGRITRIFLQAFANKELRFEKVVVFDTNPLVVNDLKASFSFIESGDLETVSKQSVLFIALHPPVIMETLSRITKTINPEAWVISLAPKVTIDKISTLLATHHIARLIPNATSYINQGYNPVTFATGFDPADRKELMVLLNVLGKTFEVEESKLEAYAILSAMLPTYFWFQWNELSKLGLQMGLTDQESKESVQHTLEAALRMLFSSGLQPEKVMDLIPVKPIGDHEEQITDIYNTKLLALFSKIKP